MTWARFIRHHRNAVTCPWEVWEKLPDGRETFIGAFQTLPEAEANLR